MMKLRRLARSAALLGVVLGAPSCLSTESGNPEFMDPWSEPTGPDPTTTSSGTASPPVGTVPSPSGTTTAGPVPTGPATALPTATVPVPNPSGTVAPPTDAGAPDPSLMPTPRPPEPAPPLDASTPGDAGATDAGDARRDGG